MLKFILPGSLELSFVCSNFNTSHVEVYPTLIANKKEAEADFNTSHVEVYLVNNTRPDTHNLFQYISC